MFASLFEKGAGFHVWGLKCTYQVLNQSTNAFCTLSFPDDNGLGGHGLDLDLPRGSLDLNASFHFHVLVL